MAKRYRALTARPGELKLGWGREDRYNNPGIMVAWGDGVARANGSYLLNALCYGTFGPEGAREEMRPSFIKELEERGFDLSTLKISIQKKKAEPDE